MAGLKAKASNRRRQTWIAIILVGLLIASEFLIPDLRHFWISHAMFTSLVAFVASLMLTLLLFDELRQQREEKRWEMVSEVALRRLSGAAFKACAGLLQVTGFRDAGDHLVDAVDHLKQTGKRPGVDASPLLPQDYEQNLAGLLADPSYRASLVEVATPLTHELDEALAQWAPVMLASPNLADRLDVFSMMRSMLMWTLNSVEDFSKSERDSVMFWSNLRVFLLAYATFDAIRRDFLSEENSALFGETAHEHDQAWGLPFKAQKWLWKDGALRYPPEQDSLTQSALKLFRSVRQVSNTRT